MCMKKEERRGKREGGGWSFYMVKNVVGQVKSEEKIQCWHVGKEASCARNHHMPNTMSGKAGRSLDNGRDWST